MRYDDIFSFLADNAADICYDPRPIDFQNAPEPQIDDRALKLAFTNVWHVFDVNGNGLIEPFDIRMNFFELRDASSAG